MIVIENVTAGICAVRADEALYMCLSSVLLGSCVPGEIIVRFEGEVPKFGNFYMEQLASLATNFGVEFRIVYAKSKGIRAARDWMLDSDTCRTRWMWMLDEDVIVEHDCLNAFRNFLSEEYAYLVGSKADVNNRRDYKDFMSKAVRHESPDSTTTTNVWVSEDHHTLGSSFVTWRFDAGNAMINANVISKNDILFMMFPDQANGGGEDTLFGLAVKHADLEARYIPRAQVFHLEKPNITFSERSSRLESVLRTCDIKGYDKETARKILPE